MFINHVQIYGNLTRDPELKSLPSGIAVTNFSVATNRKWKDKNGESKEDVEYHNIVVFGRQAETVAQYMKKGSGILVEGRLQTRSWEADGVKKYRTEIIAERTQFGPKTQSTSGYEKPQKSQETGGVEHTEADINPEDIPF